MKEIIAENFYEKFEEIVEVLKELIHELKNEGDPNKVIAGFRLEVDVYAWEELLMGDYEFAEAVSTDGKYLRVLEDERFMYVSVALFNLIYNHQYVPFDQVEDDREC